MTYLTLAAQDMYQLLVKYPPRPSDLIEAATIGCKTLRDLLADEEFLDHVHELSSRPITTDLQGQGPVAPSQTASGWKANLLNEFPSFLGEVKKVMVEHKMPSGLVDVICRQAQELRRPMVGWQGNIGDFLNKIEEVRKKTCDLIEDIEVNRANPAFQNRARSVLFGVAYLATGAALITLSTTATTLPALNPDFPKTLIAFSYEVANLANGLASGFIGIGLSIVLPSIGINRNPILLRVALSLCILLILSAITGSILYIESIGTQNPHQTTTANSDIHLPLGNITGYFYLNPGGSRTGIFDTTQLSHRIFKGSFPVIDFNPVSGIRCGSNTIDNHTTPFTDVDISNGQCKPFPAENGNGAKAGLGNLQYFEAVYLTSIHVPGKGTLTIKISADDGWILGIGRGSNGDQPTPDQNNIMKHPLISKGVRVSAFSQYPEMGDNNGSSKPTPYTIKINFPAAGTYPLEIDYTECCLGGMTLVVTNEFTLI